MNTSKQIFSNLKTLTPSNPWLFVGLVIIFYLTLPNIKFRPGSTLQSVSKLMPAQVQTEFRHAEPEFDKFLRSTMLSLITFGWIRILQESSTGSLDN